jgi:hypothetical protein
MLWSVTLGLDFNLDPETSGCPCSGIYRGFLLISLKFDKPVSSFKSIMKGFIVFLTTAFL